MISKINGHPSLPWSVSVFHWIEVLIVLSLFFTKNSEPENDEYESEFDFNQNEDEKLIEQQLDEFRNKWQKEIQQRTVYGHVLQESSKQEEKQQMIDKEEQVTLLKIQKEINCSHSSFRRNIFFNELPI